MFVKTHNPVLPHPDGMAGFVPTFHDPQVNLYVKDVEVSARFYRDFIGFRETFRTPKGGAPIKVEVRLGNLTLGSARKARSGRFTALAQAEARPGLGWSYGPTTWTMLLRA